MRYSVLKQPKEQAAAEIKKKTYVCIASILAALVLNLTFVLLSRDETMDLFLALNILVDIAAGAFAFTYYLANVSTQKKLLRLCNRQLDSVEGTVEKIGTEKQTYLSIECVELDLNGRIIFLPTNTLELSVGDKITAYCTSNVVMEVEKC